MRTPGRFSQHGRTRRTALFAQRLARAVAKNLADDREAIEQTARAEEPVSDPFPSVLPDPFGAPRIGEQIPDRAAEGGQIVRVVEENAALPRDDLVLDPADPRGDDRSSLPHCL